MIRIAFTPPSILIDEPRFIETILDEGWDYVHLRHPQSSADEVRRILDSIGLQYRSRITIHDHLELAVEYRLGGVHLNSRSPNPPLQFDGRISMSLHSVGQLSSHDVMCHAPAYVTLSPIFDSISKPGYGPQMPIQQLSDAVKESTVRVIALGGITPALASIAKQYGFDGYAVLGYLSEAHDTAELRERLRRFTA